MTVMVQMLHRPNTEPVAAYSSQRKGPNTQAPPLNVFTVNMGNCEIIMHRSEKAKLTTNMLAGDFKSLHLVNR